MLKFFKKKVNYLIVKLTIVSVTLLTTMVTFLAIPKTIFSSNAHYEVTTPMAILDQSNLLLYKYKVYADETRFNTGLIVDLEAERLQFASRNELMVVKIPGEFKIEFQSDYILMVEPEIPELNIEYYLVKNIQIDATSIPARTAILLLKDVFQTINTIYLISILIVFFLLLVPQSIQTFKILFSINQLSTSKLIKVDLKKKKLGK
jgi:hypothetical protein